MFPVIYIQPIFAPNEELLNKNLESIRSFMSTYYRNGYTFKCVFGGYCKSEEYWGLITREIGNHTVVKFDNNYGKAYVVNELSKHITDEQYILTADSDILYKETEQDIVFRLIEAFNYAKSINLNPSLISLFQEENNCQILELCYQNKYYYNGHYQCEMICHPYGNGGVAGGCLFISVNFWKRVGGYKVLGVYAGDDANIMKDSYDLGYKFLMSNSIRIIHPNENNIEYKNWKINTCPNSMEHSEAISKASDFWNK